MLLASGAADSDKTGCYIVVLKDSTTHERFMDIKSQVVSMTEDDKLHGSVEAVVKAFTVKLSDHALSIVSVVNCCSGQLMYVTNNFVLSISHVGLS